MGLLVFVGLRQTLRYYRLIFSYIRARDSMLLFSTLYLLVSTILHVLDADLGPPTHAV